ncbi:MAG: hypothetical protein RLZZ251_469, partial [Actinomycetota bacterium]
NEEIVRQKPIFETENLSFFSEERKNSVTEYLAGFASATDGYLAIMAYLNRQGEREIVQLREIVERKSARPTTFGWGPRFLHSTGQFHKGGPLVGSFLQITGEPKSDLIIPGAGYGFARLVMAQSFGDYQALSARQLPVLRLHLKKRREGVAEILAAAKEL